jgi:O-antigen/teichoic acid export membrane protein
MWLLIGGLEGQERFMSANAVTVVATALSQAVPLALGLLTDSSLLWMLVGVTLASLLGFLTVFVISVRAVPLRRMGGFDRSLALSLASYGAWVMVTASIGPLLTILDRLVIGAISGARAVTVYTVPFNLVSRVGIVPLSFARTLFPRLSLLPSDSAKLVHRQAIVGMLAIITPLLVVGMFLLEPFLRIWIGATLAPAATRVGQIVLLGVFANAVAAVPYTYLLARGRPDLPAKFHLLELLPYFVLLWVGLRYAGIEGAAWATTARMCVDAALLCGAATLPRSVVGAVGLASIPVALAYSVVAVAGDSGAVRASAGILLTAGAIIISLRLFTKVRGAAAALTPSSGGGPFAGAEGL